MADDATGPGGRLRALLRRAAGRPSPVAIRDAWLAPERYADRPIAVVGTVRIFDAGTPDAYCTLDEGDARIGLRGLPGAQDGWTGRRVRAIGTLTFRPGVGIFLDAKRIEPLP